MKFFPVISAIIFVGLLVLLYQRIPRKKVFFTFCAILIAAGSIAAYSTYNPKQVQLQADANTRTEISNQQQLFGNWYESYQKTIELLDFNWQSYHKILEDFRQNNIDLLTCYTRLSQLEANANDLTFEISQISIPVGLNEENSALTKTIAEKTLIYAKAQLETIRSTKDAANPAKQDSFMSQVNNSATPDTAADKQPSAEARPNDAEIHDEQYRRLNKIMATKSPSGLFIAKELTALRNNMALPE